MMQSPAHSSSEDSTWGAAVGAAWRAHALALETRAIEAACEERLRHVPASSSAAASAIRQWADTAVRACLGVSGGRAIMTAVRGEGTHRSIKIGRSAVAPLISTFNPNLPISTMQMDDARARHKAEAAADAEEARRVAAQQRARLRRLARTAAKEAVTFGGCELLEERGGVQQQQQLEERSPRPPPKRTLSEETRRARALLGLGLLSATMPSAAAEDGVIEEEGLTLGAGGGGEVARALLSSSPTTVEGVLAARPLLLSSSSPPWISSTSGSSSDSGVGRSSKGGRLMHALLALGVVPSRLRGHRGEAAARRRWRRLQEGRPMVAFFAPVRACMHAWLGDGWICGFVRMGGLRWSVLSLSQSL